MDRDLVFGSFLTPSAEQPEHVVELARLTEQAGLDLVSVQDHPYQARFLDTWTLLSVIAAKTSRVTVAPNVANLPLRPPAVLARSVATLDLLSGRRVERSGRTTGPSAPTASRTAGSSPHTTRSRTAASFRTCGTPTRGWLR